MPNTAKPNSSGSLGRQVDRAAKATADQRRERVRSQSARRDAGAARRGRQTVPATASSRARTSSGSQTGRSGSARAAGASRSSGRQYAGKREGTARRSRSEASSRTRSSGSSRSRGQQEQSRAKQATQQAAGAVASAVSNAASSVASGAGELAGRVMLTGGKRVAAIVLIVVLLAAVILYPVGRTYYQTIRDEQRTQAQVDAVQAYNDAISAENDSLNTDEGVEAEARAEYGWVEKGDQSALVTNAGDNGSGSKLPDQPDLESIKAPQTWYYSLLDAVFFVSE